MSRKKQTRGVQIMNEIEKKVYKDGYRPSNPQSLQHIKAVRATYNHILNGGTKSTAYNALQNDLLELGMSYSDIQSERIYREARDLIIADFEEERTFTKNKLLACLNDIYTDSRNANDRTNAINSIKEMAKLLDLYEDKKQSISVKTNDTEITIDFGLSSNTIVDNTNNNEITDAEVIE